MFVFFSSYFSRLTVSIQKMHSNGPNLALSVRHATPRRLIDVLASNELGRDVELQQMKRSYDDFSLANRRIELP